MNELTDDNYIPQMVYWGGFNFILMWCFVLWLISQISGWTDLAAQYPFSKPSSQKASSEANPLPSLSRPLLPTQEDDIVWSAWQHGRFRGWVGYNGCLWIGVSEEGLALKTGPDILFRFSHPPIFIPWSAVHSAGRRTSFWRTMVDLTFENASVTLSLPEKSLKAAQRWLPSF